MSIELRISNKPFYADITFKDGTRRTIDYVMTNLAGGFFTFYADKEGAGPIIFVNADTVAVVEIANATETVGLAQ